MAFHASVYDYRDTELLARLAEGGADGMTSHELADALGMKSANGEDGARAVGIRFAWMRRYGMVEFDEKTRIWVPTQAADRVLESQRVSAKTKKKDIEKLPEEEMVRHMAHITSVYRMGDPMLAAMLRREFEYGTNPRSRVWGR